MNKHEWLNAGPGRRLIEEHALDVERLSDLAATRIATNEHDLQHGQSARDHEFATDAAAVEAARLVYEAAVARLAATRQRQAEVDGRARREERDVRADLKRALDVRGEALRQQIDEGWHAYRTAAADTAA